jgi:hypothetical protein
MLNLWSGRGSPIRVPYLLQNAQKLSHIPVVRDIQNNESLQSNEFLIIYKIFG